jgi:hypothetical protein
LACTILQPLEPGEEGVGFQTPQQTSAQQLCAAASPLPPPPHPTPTNPWPPTTENPGRIHFVKFETARIGDCLDFIEAKGLHRCLGRDGFQHEMRVKATGGGAHRFAGERRRHRGGARAVRVRALRKAAGGAPWSGGGGGGCLQGSSHSSPGRRSSCRG